MKILTIYQSVLGHQFETAALAQADEDRLPRIIATYREDLRKLRAGEDYAGRSGPHPQEDIDLTARAVADYEAKWAEVQAQRASALDTAP
jgi:hypothetical protein